MSDTRVFDDIYSVLKHDLHNNLFAILASMEMIVDDFPGAMQEKLKVVKSEVSEAVDEMDKFARTEKDGRNAVLLKDAEDRIFANISSCRDIIDSIKDGRRKENLRRLDQGLDNVKDSFQNFDYILSVRTIEGGAPERVDLYRILKMVTRVFQFLNKLFPRNSISFKDVENPFGLKNTEITADGGSICAVIYNVLMLGVEGATTHVEMVRGRCPEKRLRVMIDSKSEGIEFEVTFRNNYCRWSEDQLAVSHLKSGVKTAAVLNWERENADPLAMSAKTLFRFDGRMEVGNEEHGLVVKLFLPSFAKKDMRKDMIASGL